MEIAFLFNSDAKEFGGYYGHPIQKKILDTGVLQKANRHMRVSVGDLLLMDTLRRGTSPEDILNTLLSTGFHRLKTEEISSLLNKATIYVWLVQNITETVASELGDALWKDETFLGFHQVDFTHPPHFRFYYRSLPEQLRIHGKRASILEPFESERDETQAAELRSLGFTEVTFDNVGIRGTIFDKYDTIEHYRRRASFEEAISVDLPGGRDEASNLCSFLDEIHPKLFEVLASAIRAIENAETVEDVAQAALSGRRFLSTVADILFPPSNQIRGGHKLDASAYRNRLWAYVEDTLNNSGVTDEKALIGLGKEIDRLDVFFNKGLHAECSREEVLQELVNLSVLIAQIIAINPALTRRPYASLNVETIKEIMQI